MNAESIAKVLPDSRWIGACLGRSQVALQTGQDAESVARGLYECGVLTLARSRECVEKLKTTPFTELLEKRKRIGSAENPVTKLFPAAVTERQFLDRLDNLRGLRPTVDYRDERFSGHTLVDFTLLEKGYELPVNVKNAGTRFENAGSLVGLDPDDCIPIAAYKAYDAVEKEPNLIYAVSIDYTLIRKIESYLLTRFNKDEEAVWRLLNIYSGPLIRDAEDKFVYSMVSKHWTEFSEQVALPVFKVVSARKIIRILQMLPKRTPGVGLRAWGTGASAEVNVHVSVSAETKDWDIVHQRIETGGILDIIDAVNRRRTELVFDPEI